MDDDRIDTLIGLLKVMPEGFANWCIMRSELLAALEELRKHRDKPLHCPCCDGDHP